MRVEVELDAAAPMRDGTLLRANVYRPAEGGPWPTLLTRLPYGKDINPVIEKLDPVQAARRGFMVVVQDTRGRFASDGEWEPFRFERDDGFDSVEWAARLPGSSGRVGMYGDSYFGNTAWTAAASAPAALGAISPALTWADPMDGLFARGGAMEFGLAISWSLEHSIGHLSRLGLERSELDRRIAETIDDYDRLATDGYWELPSGSPAVLARPGVRELGSLRALGDPEIAGRCRVSDDYEKVTVPTLHTAGWHDIFLQGSLDNFAAMAGLGRDARLVVGPWTHLGFADPIGELLYGLRASRFGAPAHELGDLNDLQLAWFGRHLDGWTEPALPEAPVRIFVMGRNRWRDESGWPPARAVSERWFLREDGLLANDGPGGEGVTEFDYDPGDPVPTLGGQTVMSRAYPAGPLDQSRIEGRDDVCVFTSAPLAEELEVTGRLRAVLQVESSAPSTDWVARLCDVDPDGRSFNLCDGILRIAAGADEAREVEVDLWSTCNVFLPGHRLRVHVTSSSFPRWDRNLNTGEESGSSYRPARQRLHHGPVRASYLELPVIR
jgi:uncharacterized protein